MAEYVMGCVIFSRSLFSFLISTEYFISLCYTMSVGEGERSFADGDPENSFAGWALPERAAGIPGIRGDRPR